MVVNAFSWASPLSAHFMRTRTLAQPPNGEARPAVLGPIGEVTDRNPAVAVGLGLQVDVVVVVDAFDLETAVLGNRVAPVTPIPS